MPLLGGQRLDKERENISCTETHYRHLTDMFHVVYPRLLQSACVLLLLCDCSEGERVAAHIMSNILLTVYMLVC